MSKSLGNGVDPVDCNRMGGEIVACGASIDFREDMAASENLMQRCSEIYAAAPTLPLFAGQPERFRHRTRPRSRGRTSSARRYCWPHRELTEKMLDCSSLRVPPHLPRDQRVRHWDLSSFYWIAQDRMYTFAPPATNAAPRRPCCGRFRKL